MTQKTKESKNFKYFDELIHSGSNKIVLDFDIVLDECEESEYLHGITVDLDDIVIDGNGHSIDACEKAAVFFITGKNIIIQNITLKNGRGIKGGAIHNKGNLTIKESTLTKNTAEDGGAVYNDQKSNLTIINSTIRENIAKNDGGAIRNVHSNLSIMNSIICENIAKNDGGAICHSFNYGLTEVRRSLKEVELRRYPELHAMAERNAQWTERRLREKEIENSRLIIEESSITNNTAKNNGGAIWQNNENTLTLNNCNFSDNAPDDVI